MRGLFFAGALAGFSLIAGGAFADSVTLKAAQDRGALNCGVSQGIAGFSIADAKGVWSGFDVDFCRALAAAIFNDPQKVNFVPLSAEARFDALRDKKIDVLSRNSTWTMGRESGLGVVFTHVDYYDGQAFLVARSRNLQSALELDGAKMCVQAGTTTEPNFVDYFTANHMNYTIVHVDQPADMVAAFQAGKCDAMTSDASQLYALRSQMAKPGDSVILPDIISKEPLGPAVRQDDMQWFNIVKWVGFALIDAEEVGVGSNTLDEAMKSQKPAVAALVGREGDFGKQLGLSNDWAANALRATGNYAQIFERNVGAHSALGIPRGLNELWSNGGILYAPPLR